jgi:hypothetical protein
MRSGQDANAAQFGARSARVESPCFSCLPGCGRISDKT